MAKEKTKVGHTGHAYEFTKKKMDAADLAPQEKIVYEALRKHAPATAHQIAEHCKGLKTKQGALRVVRFYLGEWKRAGLVQFVVTSKKDDTQKAAQQKAEKVERRLRKAKIVAKEPLEGSLPGYVEQPS